MARANSLSVTVLLTVLVALGPISTDLYLPSLPAIGTAFAVDAAAVQLTLSVFLAGFACGQLICGPLSDRFGRRPIILGGLALYLLASLLCVVAPDIEVLILARFLQALGACVGPVLGRAVVRDVYGREGAAQVLSYMAMAMALAPAIGPIVGGYLEVWFGWQANFLLLTAFASLALIAILAILPETNKWMDPAATQPARLAANYLTLLRHRSYLGYAMIIAFSYAGIFSFISGSAFVLIGLLGLSPDLYGFCFAAIVVGYMIGTFLSGRLTKRLGLERMIQLGSLVQGFGGLLGLLLVLGGMVTVVSVVGPVAVFMIGCGLVLPNAQAGALGPFPRIAGSASALMGFFQMGFAALVGIAVGHGSGTSALPMMAAIALVSLGAILAYWLVVRLAPPLAAQAD
ncbi:multidrug effflux MFS transporter [Pelagibius litoralis]|uniref:Bcr/CflA family efflux transporter n=1 Tax=Pelagibius litoralis TaxID=374515 RepID=A0A967C3U9_9PROT|nr:multidrug effflux MFS transporter [Pelagibius litoralis]NIA68110.1 multidrug effflux MFS transporter [Pelagibius litoralis]